MTVNAITDTEKGRTGIAPTYLHTTRYGTLTLQLRYTAELKNVLLTTIRKSIYYKNTLGSMKISRRNPCSPFFSVSYSINRHKILQYLFSIIVPPRGSVRVQQ